jgi:hypothetical protein
MASPAFDDVTFVLVEVAGYSPPAIIDLDQPVDDGTHIAVIAGASVGGAALLVLIAFVVVRQRNGKDNPAANEVARAPSDAVPKIAVST